MPDIFDEVEEDLRAERARALGRRYASTIAAAIVLTLAGTGAYVFWQQRKITAVNDVANRFITAARQADHAAGALGQAKPDAETAHAAQSLAEIAATGPAGYRVLARLRLAALQSQTGQPAQAIASWQSVSDDASAPILLRDLATLTSAQHQVDSGDPVLLKQRLETLTAPGNRYGPMAEQTIALIDLRTGRTQEAATIMRRLTTGAMVPDGIRSMAADLLTTLPADAAAELPHASPAALPTGSAPHASPAPASPAHASHDHDARDPVPHG